MAHPAETFLRWGAVWTSAKDMGSEYADRQDATSTDIVRWIAVVVPRREWCTDQRDKCYVCPTYLLLFGVAVAAPQRHDSGDTDAAEPDSLVLLRAIMIPLSPIRGYSSADYAQRVLDEIDGAWNAVPERRRPSGGVSVHVADSATHAATGIFSRDDVLRHVERRVSISSSVRLRFLQSVSPGIEQVAHHAADWSAANVSVPYVSIDATCSRRTPQLLHFMACMYPQLLTEPTQSVAQVPLVATPLESDSDNSTRNKLLTRPSRWIEHSLVSSDAPLSWPHVAVVQMPSNDRIVSRDGIVAGAFQPATPSAALHLHRDAGDVRYARKGLLDAAVPADTYDELLPPDDDSVQVTFGCVEGTSFDDLDIVAGILPDGFPTPSPLVSKYSCSSMMFPQIQCRRPTGSYSRATPVDAMKMQVNTTAELSPEMLASALAAVRWFTTECLTQPHKAWALLYDPKAMMTCAWCGRQRLKLSKCTACRATAYCCRSHQANDWRGSHKAECKLWKRAVEEYATLSLSEAHTASSALLPSSEASDANTIAVALRVMRGKPTHDGAPAVFHVVSFSGDIDALLRCMHDARTFFETCAREGGWLLGTNTLADVRFVLCCDPRVVPDGRCNEVYRLSSASTVPQCVPSTGVAGDVWRERRASSITPEQLADNRRAGEGFAITVRLHNEKYHSFLARHLDGGVAPDGVIVVGDSTGKGLSFFDSITEIVTDEYLGRVPTFVSDASYVAAERTIGALRNRLETTSKNVLRDVFVAGWNPSPMLNIETFDKTIMQCDAHPLPVPLHRNLYYATLPISV